MKNKTLIIFMIVLVVLNIGVSCIANISAKTYAPADVNMDGVVTSIDLAIATRYKLGGDKLTDKQFKQADMNCDGVVDYKDLTMIRECVLNQ